MSDSVTRTWPWRDVAAIASLPQARRSTLSGGGVPNGARVLEDGTPRVVEDGTTYRVVEP